LASVQNIIDVPFWISKFKRLALDVDLVKQVVKESSI